eukprot:10663298-Alexandrium_andersonii.AAC.1
MQEVRRGPPHQEEDSDEDLDLAEAAEAAGRGPREATTTARAWTLGPSHYEGRCPCVVAAGRVRAERGVLPRARRAHPEAQDQHVQLV